jgi:hypothetical protein
MKTVKDDENSSALSQLATALPLISHPLSRQTLTIVVLTEIPGEVSLLSLL